MYADLLPRPFFSFSSAIVCRWVVSSAPRRKRTRRTEWGAGEMVLAEQGRGEYEEAKTERGTPPEKATGWYWRTSGQSRETPYLYLSLIRRHKRSCRCRAHQQVFLTLRMTSFRRSTLSTPANASILAIYNIANMVATAVMAARQVYRTFAPRAGWRWQADEERDIGGGEWGTSGGGNGRNSPGHHTSLPIWPYL